MPCDFAKRKPALVGQRVERTLASQCFMFLGDEFYSHVNMTANSVEV